MAYVIAEPCIGVKDNSCVEAEQLYIDPDECIDCDACVEACPVDAIFAEDQLPHEWLRYAQINADYYTS
jgi:ferredoxin